MLVHKTLTQHIQWHKAIEYFDYNPTIDWAIELISQGYEHENILILASFSKPVDRAEISPYVSAVLRELNLEEKYNTYSPKSTIHYLLDLIINDCDIVLNLQKVYSIHIDSYKLDDPDTSVFFSLYHAWETLKEYGDGDNYYYEGANLDNIETLIKKEATIWIDVHINNVEPKIENNTQKKGIKESTNDNLSLWKTIIKWCTE